MHILRIGATQRNNARGDTFLDFLTLNELTILNDPQTECTFKIKGKKGTPDFTIGGQFIRNALYNWKTDDNYDSLSDHIYCSF